MQRSITYNYIAIFQNIISFIELDCFSITLISQYNFKLNEYHLKLFNMKTIRYKRNSQNHTKKDPKICLIQITAPRHYQQQKQNVHPNSYDFHQQKFTNTDSQRSNSSGKKVIHIKNRVHNASFNALPKKRDNSFNSVSPTNNRCQDGINKIHILQKQLKSKLHLQQTVYEKNQAKTARVISMDHHYHPINQLTKEEHVNNSIQLLSKQQQFYKQQQQTSQSQSGIILLENPYNHDISSKRAEKLDKLLIGIQKLFPCLKQFNQSLDICQSSVKVLLAQQQKKIEEHYTNLTKILLKFKKQTYQQLKMISQQFSNQIHDSRSKIAGQLSQLQFIKDDIKPNFRLIADPIKVKIPDFTTIYNMYRDKVVRAEKFHQDFAKKQFDYGIFKIECAEQIKQATKICKAVFQLKQISISQVLNQSFSFEQKEQLSSPTFKIF